MADTTNPSYLSIGEVLGLLLEEFPDVTISKIRFLESQGLISPERTSSGYRKFYDDDVQLLRVILAEQRENYLPLRVIKDRLETGEIDPTGENIRPHTNGDETGAMSVPSTNSHAMVDNDLVDPTPVEPAAVPETSIAAHPAARHQPAVNPEPLAPISPEVVAARAPVAEPEPTPSPQLLPGVLLDRGELCAMVGMTDDELDQLESFGIISSRDSGGVQMYGEDAVEIAQPACEFLRSGVDARHLRNWKTAAEREASLFEQLVTPRFRQRNPEARADALDQLRQLDALGGRLRAALTKHALRHHFEA